MFDALYIGRFQPFHIGHLHAIKVILSENENLLIGIGSSENSFEMHNPLTCSERREIIEGNLEVEGVSNVEIVEISDINDNERWVSHVEALTPDFEKVYSGRELVQNLFKKDGKHEVVAVDFLDGVNATMIRERALNGEDFSELVSDFTAQYLEKIGFVDRIKSL